MALGILGLMGVGSLIALTALVLKDKKLDNAVLLVFSHVATAVAGGLLVYLRINPPEAVTMAGDINVGDPAKQVSTDAIGD